MKPTKTTNKIHFSDLDSTRFEDLCFMIVYKLYTWEKISHYGRKGKDNGVDIHAVLKEENKIKNWYIQCKRYKDITRSELEAIIEAATNNQDVPDRLLLIISCDVSRDNQDYFHMRCKEAGIADGEIWTASGLEAILYNDRPDLLSSYFDIDLKKESAGRESKIKTGVRMEKKIKKDFLDKVVLSDPEKFQYFTNHPYTKFISTNFIIRSTDDTLYPCIDEKATISGWFKTMIFDFYTDGLDFWLGAAMGQKIIMDKQGRWELIEHGDKRQEDPKYSVHKVKVIGRLPYYNIVDYKIDGDDIQPEPHLFCRCCFDGSPFEKIYYKQYIQGAILENWDLDEKLHTSFPK
ncbi:MAG: restriction endonuclease [Bacteroidota bacterium]